MNFLKKKKRIKLIAQVLVAMSVFGMESGYNLVFTEPIQVNAATTSTTTINKLTYTYSGTTASVTSSTATGSIVIPSTIIANGTTYNVTSISDWAFDNGYGQQVTSVTIPNSVTSIGNYAFDGTYITSLTIPNSVKTIGKNCFYNCINLVSVTIPNSVTTIGNYAFTNCNSLKSVTIPNSITSIGNGVFLQCKGLTSVTIPSSVTAIGIQAFESCTSLTSVTIPISVTSMGESAFEDCTGLKSVYIENGNPSANRMLTYCQFNGCSNVTTLKLGNITYTLDNSKLTATTSINNGETTVQLDNNIYHIVISK